MGKMGCPASIRAFRRLVILWGLVWLVAPAAAELLPEDSLGEYPIENGPATYLAPNETNPQDARALLGKSNGGIYVSVGSERSFIGAAMAKAGRIVVVDTDPEIIRFVRLNAALLRVARDRK